MRGTQNYSSGKKESYPIQGKLANTFQNTCESLISWK